MGQYMSSFQKSEFVETMKSNPMKIKVNEKSSENKEVAPHENKEAVVPENKEAEVPQNKEVAAPDIY